MAKPAVLIADVHYLTNVDHDARMANCTVCGEGVPIRCDARKSTRKSPARFNIQCRTRYLESKRAANSRRRRTSSRAERLWAKYRLRPEDYDRMFIAQGGRCGICGDPFSSPTAGHVDHDHATGVVRGLLCRPCNLALGFLRDNSASAVEAAGYLAPAGAVLLEPREDSAA